MGSLLSNGSEGIVEKARNELGSAASHGERTPTKEIPKRVGLVYDERMEWHQGPAQHPECPQRLSVIYSYLKEAQLWKYIAEVESREATSEELMLVHPESHLDKIFAFEELDMQQALEKRGGPMFPFGPDTFVSKHTPMAARLSAGSLLSLCDAVMDSDNEVTTGFALIRPPGHHAKANKAMGFCFFNNVAIATRYLQDKHGISKVAIVDWDVHHGNGTNDIFLKDPNVLFMSFHRSDGGSFYPGSGSVSAIGTEGARAYTINVPLDKGFGDADVEYVYDNVFAPAIASFKPDFILVSSGFDAAKNDPLGACRVTGMGYQYMTRQIYHASAGRCVFALEGGYNLTVLPQVTHAVLEELIILASGKTDLSSFVLERLDELEIDTRISESSWRSSSHPSCPSEELHEDMAHLSSPALSPDGGSQISRETSGKSQFTVNSRKKSGKVQGKTITIVHQSTELHNCLELKLPVSPAKGKKKKRASGAPQQSGRKDTEKDMFVLPPVADTDVAP